MSQSSNWTAPSSHRQLWRRCCCGGIITIPPRSCHGHVMRKPITTIQWGGDAAPICTYFPNFPFSFRTADSRKLKWGQLFFLFATQRLCLCAPCRLRNVLLTQVLQQQQPYCIIDGVCWFWLQSAKTVTRKSGRMDDVCVYARTFLLNIPAHFGREWDYWVSTKRRRELKTFIPNIALIYLLFLRA